MHNGSIFPRTRTTFILGIDIINYESGTFTIKAKYSQGGDKNQCGSTVQITGNCDQKNIASGNPLKFTTDDPKLKGDINKGTVRCLF